VINDIILFYVILYYIAYCSLMWLVQCPVGCYQCMDLMNAIKKLQLQITTEQWAKNAENFGTGCCSLYTRWMCVTKTIISYILLKNFYVWLFTVVNGDIPFSFNNTSNG
jgi:hypothetical protein